FDSSGSHKLISPPPQMIRKRKTKPKTISPCRREPTQHETSEIVNWLKTQRQMPYNALTILYKLVGKREERPRYLNQKAVTETHHQHPFTSKLMEDASTSIPIDGA
ncbi:unnamed protein product, partial [Dovyalis caffra]